MNFLLASGNVHKAEEFAEIFNPELVSIQAAPEKVEVEENGTTYHQNALLKAKGYFEKFQKPVMADDSGLNVEALPDELGIYSARFGGEDLGYQEKCDLLMQKLDGKVGEERKAWFACILCFYFGPDEYYFFEGRMNGRIGHQYRGDHGFGYDPVFIPEHNEGEDTLAMLPEWKKTNSHRAQACIHAEKFFKERIGQN